MKHRVLSYNELLPLPALLRVIVLLFCLKFTWMLYLEETTVFICIWFYFSRILCWRNKIQLRFWRASCLCEDIIGRCFQVLRVNVCNNGCHRSTIFKTSHFRFVPVLKLSPANNRLFVPVFTSDSLKFFLLDILFNSTACRAAKSERLCSAAQQAETEADGSTVRASQPHFCVGDKENQSRNVANKKPVRPLSANRLSWSSGRIAFHSAADEACWFGSGRTDVISHQNSRTSRSEAAFAKQTMIGYVLLSASV